MARDIGRAVFDAQRKPDGTPLQQSPYPSFLKTGTATVLKTQTINVKATDPLKDGKSTAPADPKKPLTFKKNLNNIIVNPLEQFASFTPLFTLACLTPRQFNDPSTYRDNPAGLENIVFSSAGRFDAQRTRTASGVPEYYVDDVNMSSTIAANPKSGNQNVFKFDFEIFEPYSMGLFLESLQLAALKSGYSNYLNNAPFLLQLDFKGYKDNGEIIKSVKSKYFVLKLTKTTFNVEESGSKYQVEGVPYNHQGFSDVIDTAFNDIKLISGQKGDVVEILKTGKESLVTMLNNNEKKLKDAEMIGIPDVYDIQFPEKSSDFTRFNKDTEDNRASFDPKQNITNPTVDYKNVPSLMRSGGGTQNYKITNNTVDRANAPSLLKSSKRADVEEAVNVIGKSSLGFTQASGGNFAFKKYNEAVDEKTGKIIRDQVTIDPKRRTFQFAQGQTLTSIIENVILSSQYARTALDPKNLTPQGYVKWFRIDVQIELLDLDPIIGDYAKKITYRVVPHYVHHTIFSNPNSAPFGYEELQNKIAKEYNYIYTGQNTDVLDFNIEIDKLFYTGINPSPETDSANASNQDMKGVATDAPTVTKTGKGPSQGAQFANTGRSRPKRDPKLLNKFAGGSSDKSTEQLVAEAFNSALKTGASADLVKIDLEILGDTYWLMDSGMGNYFSPTVDDKDLITLDGTANYESGMVYVYITFRTPVDLNDTTGLYNLPKENTFTGIYRVTECQSKFSSGKFIQSLKCVRMPGQVTDFDEANSEIKQSIQADKNTALAVEFTDEQRARVTVSDPIIPSILTGSGRSQSSTTDNNEATTPVRRPAGATAFGSGQKPTAFDNQSATPGAIPTGPTAFGSNQAPTPVNAGPSTPGAIPTGPTAFGSNQAPTPPV